MAKKAFHDILLEVLGAPFPDGKSHCYFQPPTNIQMRYPCILYNYTNDNDIFADNISYVGFKRYTVTIIDEDPDSRISERLKERFLYCGSDRNFVKDGLNHFVYTVYYNGPRIKEENRNG